MLFSDSAASGSRLGFSGIAGGCRSPRASGRQSERYNRVLVRVNLYVRLVVCVLAGSIAATGQSPPRYTVRTLVQTARTGLSAGLPATAVPLVAPTSVAGGPDGEIYIGDDYYQQVIRVRGGSAEPVAGIGEEGFSGDGGPATEARFRGVGAMVVAGREIFICDRLNFRIRRISGDGVIETIAGDGSVRSSGDGGPAILAGIGIPSGLARDAAGSLYFSDSLNHRIRRVTAEGTIETIAGTGEAGFSGDGDAARNAQLNGPGGVAVDATGNVFFADTGNHRLRRIMPDGRIETVAGTGAAGLAGDSATARTASLAFPGAVAAGEGGVVYVAEIPGGIVRRIDAAGTMTRLAGGGAAAAETGSATGIRMFSADALAMLTPARLAIVDRAAKRVRFVDLGQGTTGLIAGGGALGGRESMVVGGAGVAVDQEGVVFVADELDHTVKRVSSAGAVATFAGTGAPGAAGDGGPAAASQMQEPAGAGFDSEGDLYVTTRGGSRIRKIDRGGGSVAAVGGTTDGFAGDGGAATSARFALPSGVAFGRGGVIYVADTANHRVRRIRADGVVTTIAGTGAAGFGGDGGLAFRAQLHGPAGLAVDGIGALYIADSLNHRVRRIDPDGTITTVAGTGAAGSAGDGVPAVGAQLNGPKGLAIDAGGNLFVGNSWGAGVALVTPDGMVHRVAGDAGVGGVEGVAVSESGEVTFWDRTNRRAMRLDPIPLNDDAVVNLASQRAGPIAPGCLFLIRGIALGPTEGIAAAAGDDGLLPTRLGGTAVFVDGVAAPLLVAQYSRVVAMAPYGIGARGTVELAVDFNGRRTNPVRVDVRPVAPAVFTRDGRGVGLAVARNGDGSDNFDGNPTFRGDIVTLVATGLGETEPATVAGRLYAEDGITSAARVRVFVGEAEAEVVDAEVPLNQLSGVFEIRVRIPSGAPAGAAVPVSVRVGDVVSPAGPVIAVE